ncbi:MAG: hypothetical protein JWM96_1062 [Alphaproteobacteria bacterium]|nr:hypothetical protein [Alphaproteobacteria bacterium]
MKKHLKLASWNLACGAGPEYRCCQLEQIITVLKEENPDIILLQEIDKNIARSGNRDIPFLLGQALQLEAFFAPAIKPLEDGKGSIAPDNESGFGNAVLSRHGFTEMRNIPLGPGPGGEGEQEHRSAAYVQIDLGGIVVQVFSTHLVQSFGAPSPIRVAQVAALCHALHPGLPLIGGGDFNINVNCGDLQALASITSLLTPGLGPTCSLAKNDRFIFAIDHLFGRDITPERAVKKAFPDLSDHCMVTLEFSVNSSQ